MTSVRQRKLVASKLFKRNCRRERRVPQPTRLPGKCLNARGQGEGEQEGRVSLGECAKRKPKEPSTQIAGDSSEWP